MESIEVTARTPQTFGSSNQDSESLLAPDISCLNAMLVAGSFTLGSAMAMYGSINDSPGWDLAGIALVTYGMMKSNISREIKAMILLLIAFPFLARDLGRLLRSYTN